MKIITLNIWGGRLKKKLINFIESKKDDTDIFCFQEVFHNATKLTNWNSGGADKIFEDIQNILPNYIGYTSLNAENEWGLAMFIKKSLSYKKVSDLEVFPKEKGYIHKNGIREIQFGQNIQYVDVKYKNSYITIINFHGLWNGKGKTDTEDRLEQSRNIFSFIKENKYSCILCGDYNLSSNTKSLKMLEDIPLKNLIKEYNVVDTRTIFYKKENRFADYILLDIEINIEDFKVLPDVVSDHAALYLEIT